MIATRFDLAGGLHRLTVEDAGRRPWLSARSPPNAVCNWMPRSPPYPPVDAESMNDLREKQAHPVRDARPLEDCRRVLVLVRRLAGVHGCDVRGELGLVERPLQHVGVGKCDLAPYFQGVSFLWSNSVF